MMQWIISWALARLNERATWLGWLSLLGAKFGVHFAPQFDTLAVNACLSILALVAYAVKGGPVVLKIQPKHK